MKAKKLTALVLAGALCLSAFTGCGINANDTAATLGDTKVTLGVTNFICKYQQAALDDFYRMYFGNDVWNTDLFGSGSTLGQDVKDSVMESLHEMYTLKAHMADYGVTITEDEEKAIKEAAAAFIASNSDAVIKEFGATEDVVVEVLTLYTIQAKMYKVLTADTDRNVSDEEANMRGYSMVTISLEGTYDEDGNAVELTEEELATIKNNAISMQSAISNVGLEEAAKEYDYEVTTGAYGKDDESLEETVLKAMDALKEGEVSPMIETETAIYFVRIDKDTDEDATEENRNAIIQEREDALYKEALTKLQENDGWTVDEDVVAKIKFHNILTQQTESTESVNTTEGE